ncbi:MAG: P-loop NTPase [Candidatus Micrarchaeota archaeon]|nr:P-loop NTPase [Candidatus Micrarchaeota archaeon]
MDKKPYLIFVASQKGGVGKTTIALNLSIALTYQDYSVLLIDSDVATFSVKEHLGIQGSGKGYIDAITGKATVADCIFSYQPVGLDLILGDTGDDTSGDVTPDSLNKFYSQVLKLSYDFIIVDGQPGLFNSTIAKYLNDVIIVTTPDNPSAISSAKLSSYCEKLKVSHRLLINRTGYSKFELTREGVERLFGDVAYATMPEDKIIPESLAKHRPAYMLDRGSGFATAIEALSRVYMLRVGEPETHTPVGGKKRRGFFGRFARWAINDTTNQDQGQG